MAMALLLSMNLFNYIDRQVLAAVEPEIRRDLLLQMKLQLRLKPLVLSVVMQQAMNPARHW